MLTELVLNLHQDSITLAEDLLEFQRVRVRNLLPQVVPEVFEHLCEGCLLLIVQFQPGHSRPPSSKRQYRDEQAADSGPSSERQGDKETGRQGDKELCLSESFPT